MHFWLDHRPRREGDGGLRVHMPNKLVIKEMVAGDRPFDWRVDTLQPTEGTKAKVIVSTHVLYTAVQHV